MAILKSRKFILRPYRKGDESSLIRNINDRHVYRNTCSIPYPYTRKDALEFIKSNKLPDAGKKMINFAIDVGGEAIGGIGFREIKIHRAEIGYWLGRKYWNRGIMSEALRLATDFGFKKLRLRRVYAIVFCRNMASARILKKNNYKLEGVMKKYTLKDGKLIDVMIFAKIK
ncbi:GNAT family N-acetyltransferase [Candidatus Woesearchaeota archaeon]|nr:GNAT family N-acetyltransferase [Candidatus Woesearchaeota archaeon]